MPAKKYQVNLTAEERTRLSDLIRKGTGHAYQRRHAEVLLKADQGVDGPAWTDKQIHEAFDMASRTVERIRQSLVEQGLDAALERAKSKNPRASKLDGDQEAYLTTLACQSPPEGRSRWTLRLLAEQMVALDYVDTLSHETVRQTLKKTLSNLGNVKNGVSLLKPMPPLSAQWKMY